MRPAAPPATAMWPAGWCSARVPSALCAGHRRAPDTPQVFYTVTGSAGYMALGDDVGPNVLTSFTGLDKSRSWLPLLANIMVLVHLVPAYQVGGTGWESCGGAGPGTLAGGTAERLPTTPAIPQASPRHARPRPSRTPRCAPSPCSLSWSSS